MRWLLPFVAALLLAACAAPRLHVRHVEDGPTPIRVVYDDATRWDAELVAALAPAALTRAAAWGRPVVPLILRLYADHAAFEEGIHFREVPWLRAWATYDTIHLQAPSSWGGQSVREHTERLLTHEMTHVVMYQRAGTREDWYRKPLPLWFREGMALVTAGPDDAYPVERLRAWYLQADFAADPFEDGEALLRTHPREVYALSYLAFADLQARTGHAALATLLDQVRAGAGFQEAFRHAAGEGYAEWTASWREAFLSAP